MIKPPTDWRFYAKYIGLGLIFASVYATKKQLKY